MLLVEREKIVVEEVVVDDMELQVALLEVAHSVEERVSGVTCRFLGLNVKLILNGEKAFIPPINPLGPKIVPNNERKNYYEMLGQPRFELGPPMWKVSYHPLD